MTKSTTKSAGIQDETTSFEYAIGELEQIVTTMETGQLSLEEALHAFERGIALLQNCQKMLGEVEQKIRILNDAQQLITYQNSDD